MTTRSAPPRDIPTATTTANPPPSEPLARPRPLYFGLLQAPSSRLGTSGIPLLLGAAGWRGPHPAPLYAAWREWARAAGGRCWQTAPRDVPLIRPPASPLAPEPFIRPGSGGAADNHPPGVGGRLAEGAVCGGPRPRCPRAGRLLLRVEGGEGGAWGYARWGRSGGCRWGDAAAATSLSRYPWWGGCCRHAPGGALWGLGVWEGGRAGGGGEGWLIVAV